MKKKLTMLIADNVEVNRVSLREIFQKDYVLLEASDGLEAIEMLHKNHIDLVLMELFMPNLDGAGVLRQMKAEEGLAGIPVLIKTAVDAETEVRMLEMGADDFIFSPCDPAIIRNRVDHIAHRYILEQQMLQNKITQEKKLNQVLEAFITGVSLELKSPIDEILEITARSSEALDDADSIREVLSEISCQGEYLISLLNAVSELSVIYREKPALQKIRFDLDTVCAAVYEAYHEICSKKGVTIEFDTTDIRYGAYLGDQERTVCILSRLLDKICQDARPGGCIRISFSEYSICESEVMLEIIIGGDFGKNALGGMKKSGIELVVTKCMAELLGGLVTAETDTEKEAWFTVRLPFEDAEEPSEPPKRFDSMETLLIDDDEIRGKYYAVGFSRLGIRCRIFKCGETALQFIREIRDNGGRIDICYVNWHMENGKGAYIIKEIRKLLGENTIIMGGSCVESGIEESKIREAGADYGIVSPLYQSTLYHLATGICKRAAGRKMASLSL